MRFPIARALAVVSLIALAAAAVGGCGPQEAAGSDEVEVDTVAGIVVVRNRGTPPEWPLERVLTLGREGDVGEAAPDEFARVVSVLADDDGNVYVADRQANRVQVFDGAGKHLRSIGRQGAGPGEFGDLYALGWLGDTLAALDPRNARIELLTRDAAAAGTWLHQPLTGASDWVRIFRASDTLFFTRIVRPGSPRDAQNFAAYGRGGARDTLSVPRMGDAGGGVVCRTPDGGISFFESPFAPRPVMEFSPRGEVVLAYEPAFRLVFTTAEGDTVRVVEREHLVAPVTDAEWEEATGPWREFRGRWPGADCDPGSLSRPAARSAVSTIVFSPAGEMWVESVEADGGWWNVFDAEGRQLGRAAAPERIRRVPPYVRGDHLYLVRHDSLEVDYVDVYRVTRRGR